MTLGRKFLLSALAASQLASANARPLSDVELKEFYGYKYVDGPSRKLPVPLDATETLKSAAERAGIYVAAAINYNGMTGGIGPEYPAIALSQFSGFTAENECKVSETQPAPGTYTYDQCTYIVQQAINNGSMYRFHNTAWGVYNPGWLTSMNDPTQLANALTYHITNITDHFLYNKSLAYYAIDVVNEAVSDSGTAILKPADPWYPALTDYVNVAFAAAGKASAGAPTKPLLCYNDYAAEGASSAKAGKVLALVKQLQAAGLPINCVGLQMHIALDSHPDPKDVSANIAQLGALGITVHITEMDVKCPNCTSDRLEAQGQLYADILQACLENANCASFETWGLYDAGSWVGEDNAPLLWDAQWNAKPAFSAVLATLQAHAAAHPERKGAHLARRK